MRDIFPLIHAFVHRMEGGFVNHPNDPGGATRYGVSLRWLRSIGADLNGDGRIDADDLRTLSPELSQSLFRRHFWEAARLDALPPLVAALVYDGAVNMGASRALRQLQEACNRLHPADPLRPDGLCGPRTAERVRHLRAAPGGSLALCRLTLELRDDFYRGLAARPPLRQEGRTTNYRPFLKGWLKRTAALRDWLEQRSEEFS